MQYLGETFLFPVVDGRSIASDSTDFQYFYPCNGATLRVDGSGSSGTCGPPGPPGTAANQGLANMLGISGSGSDATLTLPDLAAPADGVQWFVSNTGPMPSLNQPVPDDAMPLVGQISIYVPAARGGQYAQADLLPCDGRLLPVPDFPALFSLLGSAFGGDGVESFAVPDLPPPGPSLFYGIWNAGAVPTMVPMKSEVPA